MKFPIPFVLAVSGAMAVAEPPPMEHVLVSVPLHKKSAETAMPVTVLSAEALRRAASATLGDTLDNTPGLTNASFGPGVGQPVIRGQQGSRVTVLQNGTSSADASNLSADHAVAVEAMLADSIEVLRGPATLLYGGGAIGGVVNVLDNRIPTAPVDDLTGGGEFRHDTASDSDTAVLRLEVGSGPFAWHLDALYRDWNDLEIPGEASAMHGAGEVDPASEGNLDNTDGRTRNITLGGSYHFREGFFGLAVSRLENEYGIPVGAHAHEEEAGAAQPAGGIRLDVEQARYDAALHWHSPIAGLEVLRGFATYTDYGHDEIEPGGATGTRYSNESWEGRLELVHDAIGPFHGVFGLQARDGTFSALGEEAFVPVTDSRSLGLFLLEEFHTGGWTYEAGLRLDWDDHAPRGARASAEDFLGFSASGSIQWHCNPEWQFGLALSRAERAPATEELYSNVAADSPDKWVEHAATASIELGNPALDTEISRNLDLSARWAVDAHSVEVTLFYNDFSNYINLTNTGEEVASTPVLVYAQDDAEFYGVELAGEFAIANPAGGELTLRLFADRIRGELETGADVPRLPPARVGAGLMWSAENLTLWTRAVNAGDQDRPGANEEPTRGYTRWDLGGEYRPPLKQDLMVFLEFSNLADREIRLSTSFLRDAAPQAGRSVELGFRFTW